jgi:hypothetical protein
MLKAWAIRKKRKNETGKGHFPKLKAAAAPQGDHRFIVYMGRYGLMKP